MAGKRKEITWVVDENGCHICTSHVLDKDGYPRCKANKKQMRMNRYLFEQNYGKIPEGLWVLHKCDNPSCINIEHLFLGNAKDNVDDKIKKHRDKYCVCEKHGMSKLTEKQVLEILSIKNKSHGEISKMYNVSRSQIQRIMSKSRWKYLFSVEMQLQNKYLKV